MKVTLIGAGSREFGPPTVNDLVLSQPLAGQDLTVALMDLDGAAVERTHAYARAVAESRGSGVRFISTTVLEEALADTDFVVTAIERRRYFYWSQDFHIPRMLGFEQIYGENGGPGGLFHALRNMGPIMDIARTMERVCPDALMLNYTNPLTKLCEAWCRLSPVRTVGLCHGVFEGMAQVAAFLERPVETLSFQSVGLNHITWFTRIQDRETGADLYPELRERERRAHWLHDFDEIALSRILLRSFGLYPSPGANHIGEYIRWAADLLPSQDMQFFHDPADGDPWEDDRIPPWIYNLRDKPTETPLFHPVREGRLKPSPNRITDPTDPRPSGELAIPLMEGLVGGARHELEAVNVLNQAATRGEGGQASGTRPLVAGLPLHSVVEVPAAVAGGRLEPALADPLPEPILALLRTQCSINRLLVDAFSGKSRDRLLQALLLDPTTHSYGNAVRLVDLMFERQGDVLPALEWER
ncbi:MAG: alpha-galactosidase [Gemmatimonadetes bacterium]|nr:alpha-galactosidase [Gemmatimonadota bacterium]